MGQVRRPIEEMSMESTQILLNKIEKSEPKELGIIHFNTQIVVRDSVRKLQ